MISYETLDLESGGKISLKFDGDLFALTVNDRELLGKIADLGSWWKLMHEAPMESRA